MIEACHISKYYGNIKAVDDLSFTVKEGETFVLLGTSGCGKTTTLKMINRLIEPDQGEIFINGKNILEQPPQDLRRGIGYVLQNIGLFPHFTVKENIAVVPNLLKWDSNKTHARAKILLDKFNLSPDIYFNLYPGQLSGGQQQRVGFARALMADPPILLMDEPLGALDPITRHHIRKEFKQLDELKGKTIIIVTHDIQEAFALGDRICLMHHGSVMQIGSAAGLLLHPKNDFVKDFFSNDHFTLLLKALRIKDLLAYFKPVMSVTDKAFHDENTSLMDAIESLSLHAPDNESLLIKDKSNGQCYQLNTNQLLVAFQEKINTIP